jgi:hypothetical protein
VLLETETDTERRENLLAARFRDTERESAGVGLMMQNTKSDMDNNLSLGACNQKILLPDALVIILFV